MKQVAFSTDNQYSTGKLIGQGMFSRVYELKENNTVLNQFVVIYTNCPMKEINFLQGNTNPLLPTAYRRWVHDNDIYPPFQCLYHPRRAAYEYVYVVERLPRFKKMHINKPSQELLKGIDLFQKKFVELFEEEVIARTRQYEAKNNRYVCTSQFYSVVSGYSNFILQKTADYARSHIFNTVLKTASEQVKYNELVEYFLDYCDDMAGYSSPRIEPVTRRNLSYRENGDVVLTDLFFSMDKIKI